MFEGTPVPRRSKNKTGKECDFLTYRTPRYGSTL